MWAKLDMRILQRLALKYCESDPHLIAVETTNILATNCAEVHRGQRTLYMQSLLKDWFLLFMTVTLNFYEIYFQ